MLSIPVILGPTGIGKSQLSIELAKKLDGEIVSCDSRQVYQKMDIGTAKVSVDERLQVQHHCIDILTPDIEYSAAQWARDAMVAIENITQRGKLPIICGGTFFYYHALTDGFDHNSSPDKEFRMAMITKEDDSPGSLYRDLTVKDGAAAESLHPNDTYRIIRALQRVRDGESGRVKEKEESAPARYIPIVLERERSELYDRINSRVDAMVDSGLLNEFMGLVEGGYGKNSPGMKSVGYQEFFNYIEQNQTFNEVVSSIKQHSRKYAKKQLTWLRNRVSAALTIDAAGLELTDTIQRIENLLSQ